MIARSRSRTWGLTIFALAVWGGLAAASPVAASDGVHERPLTDANRITALTPLAERDASQVADLAPLAEAARIAAVAPPTDTARIAALETTVAALLTQHDDTISALRRQLEVYATTLDALRADLMVRTRAPALAAPAALPSAPQRGLSGLTGPSDTRIDRTRVATPVLEAAEANVTGSLAVRGVATLNDVQAASIVATGDLAVQGGARFASLESATASVTSTLAVGGLATLSNVQAADVTSSGKVESATAVVTSMLAVGGLATLSNVQAADVTSSGKVESATAVVTSTLAVGGLATLSNVQAADVTASGNLLVQGQADFAHGMAVRSMTWRDFQQLTLNSPAVIGGNDNVDGLVPANWGTFYLHVKTNVKGNSDAMFSFHLDGYTYGSAAIISSSIGGYAYSMYSGQVACTIQSQSVNFAGGLYASSHYCDPSDNTIVLKLTMDHYIYYMSMSYIGNGFSPANPPKVLGVFHFGGAGASCGGTHTCAV